MPEWMGTLLAVAGCLTPIVLASIARDRTLVAMIQSSRNDAMNAVKMGGDVTHDRINRVRDEYVRRDDLQGHLVRIDKQFDEMRDQIRRGQESTERKLDKIENLLSGRE